jgi:hypothetical protein
MSSSPNIGYSAPPGHEFGEELRVLTGIYALAIKKSEEQGKAGGTNAGEDDPKGPDKHGRADHRIIQATG